MGNDLYGLPQTGIIIQSKIGKFVDHKSGGAHLELFPKGNVLNGQHGEVQQTTSNLNIEKTLQF